jgi:hypothetical protein
MKYIDFTSLYPWAQKYCAYPVGHPVYITENFGPLKDYFGLIKCKILPPRKLFDPVLPARYTDKLIFTLCHACAEERISKRDEIESPTCNHSREERALVGTWCTLEVQEAVERGYEIIEMHEVWHFTKRIKYNPVTKDGGIFTTNINTMLKIKQEASGFPTNVKTDEQKSAYVSEYYEKEGFESIQSSLIFRFFFFYFRNFKVLNWI